ncbi:Uncharacterised protein [Vibrio cholerae]|nr:Uncharacterised protein [Vibrio cholerae]
MPFGHLRQKVVKVTGTINGYKPFNQRENFGLLHTFLLKCLPF